MSKKASPSVTVPAGFRAAGGTCGIKQSGLPDLAMIVADEPCAAAGVFTTNKVPGAPVIVSRRHLKGGVAQAIVCNSGCSNVCTGEEGEQNAVRMCEAVADYTGVDARNVLVCSTGVIGHQLPMDKILPGIGQVAGRLDRGPRADAEAARAIMTTDLVPKPALRQFELNGTQVSLGGIAKGSGMIAPNMATMLVFITTDAAITSGRLRAALKEAADNSFNRISVDEDTSTSDSVLILAGGKAGNVLIEEPGAAYDTFRDNLTDLCRDLCYQIVKDGEGATRVFRVQVEQARSVADADRVGKAIVGSPLVKTAVHGGDPNWGRLAAAAGRSGAALDPARLGVHVGDICVCEQGRPTMLDKRTARRLDRIMKAKEVTFRITLGLGDAGCEWLGCDLSRDYIRINADYHT